MRRRPGGAIRVLDVCARCGRRPYLFPGRRVSAWLPTGDGQRLHELLVCRDCDQRYATLPTPREEAALAVDLEQPVRVMEYFQTYRADAERVQRTARHFLGAAIYERERARLVAEREERERVCAEHDAEWDDDWDYRDLYEELES